MKVLHVTPHLGGGVGKAHAAIQGVLPSEVERTFVLLEAPRDGRHVDFIERHGARTVVASAHDEVAALAAEADVVQFEFWNHPRLFECLACCEFSAMRSVFWSHISGIDTPLIPAGLMEMAMRFVFTTSASLETAPVASLSEFAKARLKVINSGFGIPGAKPRPPLRDRKPAIAYLGTVDFVKMHPGFFDVIDGLPDDDVCVSVWGEVDPSGPVAARARAMRHPARVKLCGVTADPAAALSGAEIFFYPLQPGHYGTAENALIEAMSLGLVPIVWGNAAEKAIIRDGETGFVARSIEEASSIMQKLFVSPELREKVSRNAIMHVAETRTPVNSARDLMILWLGMLSTPRQHHDFRQAVGSSPSDWFMATQGKTGLIRNPPTRKDPRQSSKGTLAHFESVFPEDASLARLR
jgi:glycosyltransferase involved in cell wall biosynthesis